MSKGLINTILFFAACIALFFISQNLVAEKKIQSLDDIIASSSSPFASSSSLFASSTSEIASTTAYVINSIISTSSSDLFPDLQSITVISSKASVKAFVADTQATLEQGLSGVSALPNGVGMLFVFSNHASCLGYKLLVVRILPTYSLQSNSLFCFSDF